MNHLSSLIEHYLEYCKYQKCLDKKTLKSYRIDLRQFSEHVPITVKRKIASLKAFFHFLEYREITFADIGRFTFYDLRTNAECSDNISAGIP